MLITRIESLKEANPELNEACTGINIANIINADYRNDLFDAYDIEVNEDKIKFYENIFKEEGYSVGKKEFLSSDDHLLHFIGRPVEVLREFDILTKDVNCNYDIISHLLVNINNCQIDFACMVLAWNNTHEGNDKINGLLDQDNKMKPIDEILEIIETIVSSS